MKADLFAGLAEPKEKPVCQKGSSATVRQVADAVAGVEMIADCALCIDDSPVYDFGLVCCRVRFIMSVPALEVRQAWFERWKKKDRDMCDAVEREVAVRWQARQKKVGPQ